MLLYNYDIFPYGFSLMWSNKQTKTNIYIRFLFLSFNLEVKCTVCMVWLLYINIDSPVFPLYYYRYQIISVTYITEAQINAGTSMLNNLTNHFVTVHYQQSKCNSRACPWHTTTTRSLALIEAFSCPFIPEEHVSTKGFYFD